MRVGLVVAVLMLASIAAAQERAAGDAGEAKKKPVEAATSAGPDSTTETFGDWSIVCSTPAVAGAGERVCEVNTSIVLHGQTAPFARIAISRLTKDTPARAIALVPVNVTVTSPVKISGGDSASLSSACLTGLVCRPVASRNSN